MIAGVVAAGGYLTMLSPIRQLRGHFPDRATGGHGTDRETAHDKPLPDFVRDKLKVHLSPEQINHALRAGRHSSRTTSSPACRMRHEFVKVGWPHRVRFEWPHPERDCA
jgi:hypothetical protein